MDEAAWSKNWGEKMRERGLYSYLYVHVKHCPGTRALQVVSWHERAGNHQRVQGGNSKGHTAQPLGSAKPKRHMCVLQMVKDFSSRFCASGRFQRHALCAFRLQMVLAFSFASFVFLLWFVHRKSLPRAKECRHGTAVVSWKIRLQNTSGLGHHVLADVSPKGVHAASLSVVSRFHSFKTCRCQFHGHPCGRI